MGLGTPMTLWAHVAPRRLRLLLDGVSPWTLGLRVRKELAGVEGTTEA